MRTFTPSELRVLIHYHYLPGPIGDDSSESVFMATEKLLRLGLIAPLIDSYTTTEKGGVYVEALCCTPLPVQKWEMP